MKYYIIVLIVGLIVGKVSTDKMDDAWEDPNAWGSHLSPDCGPNVCPVCDVAEDGGLAAFYYKKLISNLFNRNVLKKNDDTGKLQRTILFTVTPDQLAIIEKTTDIRNLDTAITQILTTAKVVTGAGGAEESWNLLWLISDIIKVCFQILKVLWSNSETRFICFITGIMMLIWFIHKRYNKNLIAVLAIGFFLFGYLHTYLECNRKLEAEKIVVFVRENESRGSGWFRNMFNAIFSSSKEDKLISNIQSQTKVDLPFCRPDRVLSIYASEMFLNQIEIIIEKCMSITKTFKDSMGFPYNIIAMLCVPFLFIFLTKLLFKYFLSPSAWFYAYSAVKISTTNQPHVQQVQNDSDGDRITGSNLKRLLQAFEKHSSLKEPITSGVEVLECLENGSADRKSDESKSEDDMESSINLDKISQEKVKKDS